MMCRRCGIKMAESEKSSIFKGHQSIYRCSSCHEEVHIRERRSFAIPFLHHHEEEVRSRRAGPIELY